MIAGHSMYGQPWQKNWKLHLVKNAAKRLLTSVCAKGCEHNTATHKELHWLTICFQVQFKVLIITLKPQTVWDLVLREPGLTLTSFDENFL